MYREIDFKTEPLVNLDDLYLLDYNGIDQIKLGGEYYLYWLVDKMIDTWIRYMECHHCGRADYCKFIEANPHNENKLKEIKCGVAAKCLENFVYSTVENFQEFSKNQKQNYLDGLYYLNKFIYESEVHIGVFLEDEFVKYYGKYITGVIGRFTQLVEYLNLFSSHFKNLSEFRSRKKIILVEGWSEKVFIERIQDGGLIRNFSIQVYEGASNSGLKKLQILVNRLRDIGYDVYIQGDMDGVEIDKFQNHKKKGLFKESDIFQFQFDFESALPLFVIKRALIEMEHIDEDQADLLINDLYPLEEGFIRSLNKKKNIDLRGNKIELADVSGQIINHYGWWHDEKIASSEIGKFLMFLKNKNSTTANNG